MERFAELRARQHPRRARACDQPAARQSDVSFRLLHRECLTPIKQKRWCPKHDREVGPDELVKGWEVAKGQFVVVEEAELEALEQHDDSRTIDIERFVPLADVDPCGWTGPTSSSPGGAAQRRRTSSCSRRWRRRASARSAASSARGASRSASSGRVGRGSCSRRCTSRRTCTPTEIDEAMEETDVKKAELELARQIVDGLAAEFDPAELTSAYRRDLRTLLEAKLRGRRSRRRSRGRARAGGRPHRGAQGERRRGQGAPSPRPTQPKAKAKPAAEKRPARKAARK